jgi:sirohydrochlorin cobaltochelatase
MAQTKTAIVLFGHGARDERWKEPFLKLVELIKNHNSEQRVELSFLELMKPSLQETIDQLAAEDYTKIKVIPVFFGQGGHIRKDFPELLDLCRAKHPKIELSAKPAVGEDLGVLDAIAKYCTN